MTTDCKTTRQSSSQHAIAALKIHFSSRNIAKIFCLSKQKKRNCPERDFFALIKDMTHGG
jgi:hypothetical protein